MVGDWGRAEDETGAGVGCAGDGLVADRSRSFAVAEIHAMGVVGTGLGVHCWHAVGHCTRVANEEQMVVGSAEAEAHWTQEGGRA